MAVPEGIPLMLVFTGIFVFLVLFVACIVLSIIVKETMVRVGLVAAAILLAGVMGGGAYLTMAGGEEGEKEKEQAAIEEPVAPPETPKTPEPKVGDVVLIVDESTLTEDFDPLQTDRLLVEDPPKGKAGDANARKARAKVGQEITAIETELNNRLLSLEAQVQEVVRRSNAQEMDNYDMIFWQAKLKKQQYGYIVRAMDDKQKLLEKAAMLSKEEKAADIARIDRRRQKALEKWKEYQSALQELMDNQTVFRTI